MTNDRIGMHFGKDRYWPSADDQPQPDNELRGESCIALEEVSPAKKQIMASRSFGAPVLSIEVLREAISSYVARAAEKLRRPLARLEGHLSAHPYLVGNRFTVADINTAECVRYAQGHAELMAAFPALSAWLTGVQARPAFAAMWARRNAEPA